MVTKFVLIRFFIFPEEPNELFGTIINWGKNELIEKVSGVNTIEFEIALRQSYLQVDSSRGGFPNDKTSGMGKRNNFWRSHRIVVPESLIKSGDEKAYGFGALGLNVSVINVK